MNTEHLPPLKCIEFRSNTCKVDFGLKLVDPPIPPSLLLHDIAFVQNPSLARAFDTVEVAVRLGDNRAAREDRVLASREVAGGSMHVFKNRTSPRDVLGTKDDPQLSGPSYSVNNKRRRRTRKRRGRSFQARGKGHF